MATPPQRRPPNASSQGRPPPPDADIPLADEAEVVRQGEHEPRKCPDCGRLLAGGIAICRGCGLNTRTGIPLGADTPAMEGTACRQCGYSLSGLHTVRCPECGTVNWAARVPRRDQSASRHALKKECLKAVLILGVGLLISLAFAAAGPDPLRAAAGYLLRYSLFLPIGGALFAACSFLWLGFDAPMHLTMLRLAAVYAAMGAVWSIGGIVPLLIVPYTLLLLTTFALFVDLLDLDLLDAAILTIVTAFVRVVSGVWLTLLLAR